MKRIVAILPIVIRDAVGIAGACSVAYGAYQIYQPAGFIVGGVLALVACLLAARGS